MDFKSNLQCVSLPLCPVLQTCQVSVEPVPSSPNVAAGTSSRFHRLRSTASSLSHSALGNVQTCVDSVGSVGSTGHLMGLDPESFEHLYPFHFALDLDFKVLQAGDALRRILPQMGVPGTPIQDILTVRKKERNKEIKKELRPWA